ncbi:ABC transporter permease [Gordonia sp. VNK21]|uniref:ABC transporter permease n=1 Tax=Gordonia sp. VNK21 TaxID=3382483 RepID=UPI0038D4434A
MTATATRTGLPQSVGPGAFAVADRQASERSLRGWLKQTWVLTVRQLLVVCREWPILAQIILMPAVTMLMFKVVLGDVVGEATGTDSAFGTVPLIILVSAMNGSMVAAVKLNLERQNGVLARLWVMPINRMADFSSRLAAEALRIVITTAVLVAAGHLIGFRFTQGVGPAIGLFAVAVVFGLAFAVLTLALAVNLPAGVPVALYLSLLMTLLMFFNSGFCPIDQYPGWLQPIVANQPMTPAIDAMRAMAAGGPLAADLWKVAGWAAGIAAVLGYPALRGYRRAAVGR